MTDAPLMRRRFEGCHASAHSASEASAAARISTLRNRVRPAKTPIKCAKNDSPTFAAVPVTRKSEPEHVAARALALAFTASSAAASAALAARDASAAL